MPDPKEPDPNAPEPTNPPTPDQPTPDRGPTPGTRSPTEIPTTEPVVDMTHWPEDLRRLTTQGRRRGEQFDHEGASYEILMGTTGEQVLVTKVDAADPKPVYVMRAPTREDEPETPAGA